MLTPAYVDNGVGWVFTQYIVTGEFISFMNQCDGEWYCKIQFLKHN